MSAPQRRAEVDPFGATANPALYVSRPACEDALDALVRCLRDEGRSAVLCGPPGLGKTLLLRVLARRLGDMLRVVHLPYAALPAGALCTWALDSWGESGGYDPVGALVTLAIQGRNAGGGVVLLIDDAQALPDPTLLELSHALAEAGGALRIGAACDAESADRILAVWPDAERVALERPMAPAETARYVLGYLRAAGLPDDTWTAEALTRIHGHANGIPACVNAEASKRLRSTRPLDAALPVVAPPPARETAPVPDAAGSWREPAPLRDADAALLRAAGRLALAHGDVPAARDGEPSEAFERAVGRLVLARAETEEAGDAVDPARASLGASAKPSRARGWRVAAWLACGLGVAGAGWWLMGSGLVPLP